MQASGRKFIYARNERSQVSSTRSVVKAAIKRAQRKFTCKLHSEREQVQAHKVRLKVKAVSQALPIRARECLAALAALLGVIIHSLCRQASVARQGKRMPCCPLSPFGRLQFTAIAVRQALPVRARECLAALFALVALLGVKIHSLYRQPSVARQGN